VALTRKSKYLEWNTDELRDVMKDDKSVEAAVLNTLYLDLVRGLREQRRALRKQEMESADGGASNEAQRRETRKEYEVMMRAVLADDLVHPLEKSLLTEFAAKRCLSVADHESILSGLGWTTEEYDRGVKSDLSRVLVQTSPRGQHSLQASDVRKLVERHTSDLYPQDNVFGRKSVSRLQGDAGADDTSEPGGAPSTVGEVVAHGADAALGSRLSRRADPVLEHQALERARR